MIKIMTSVLFLIFDCLVLIIQVLCIFLLLSKIKKDENSLDKLSVGLLFMCCIPTIYSTTVGFIQILTSFTPVIKVGFMDLSYFFSIIAAIIFCWFVCYIQNMKFLIPYFIIIGLFGLVYGYYIDNDYFTYGFTIASLIEAFFLLYKSIRNHNGKTFAISFLGIMLSCNILLVDLKILQIIVSIFCSIILYLGINGWIGEELLYNREEAKKIQNTWIARNIIIAKK